MRIFLNGLGASSGSGLTYLRNVLPHLAEQGQVFTTLAVDPSLRPEFSHLPRLSMPDLRPPKAAGPRFWMEQTVLPRLIQETQSDVLISAGNFALWRSSVPQILLSGNSLYTSGDFSRDLVARREYEMWLDTRVKAWFARSSIRWADSTIAPSRSFARDLERWTGKKVYTIPHGFDLNKFRSSSRPLNPDIRQKLDLDNDGLRLLFVSHYNYYRNFETLFHALPIVRRRLASRKLRLFLTCRLQSRQNPGSYRTEHAAELVKQLGIFDEVVELGSVPYEQLHHIYEACDIYVTPAYTETFAHPLVEAMACGLPVVASDLPVHREVCGDAALFFPRFSPDQLAEQIMRLANSAGLYRRLSACGSIRSRSFSWANHVSEILSLASALIQPQIDLLPNAVWTA